MVKRYVFILALFLGFWHESSAQAIGPDSIYTFECICGYLSPQDTNCDICNATIQSRFFKGLLVRRYGVPYKWLDQPYIVKFSGQNAAFEELIPIPDKITIAMSATVFDTLPDYKAAVQCPCTGESQVYFPGDGIYFVGDTINAIDTDSLNEAWTITDGTNSEVISNQVVTFTGSGGATVSYNPATNTLTITASGGGGGDNWGTQVVLTDASLSGDGTAGNVLGISGYGAASVGQFPSKSGGGILWQTVDLSATNEIQVLTAGDGAGDNKTLDLSLSGGTVTLDPAGILTISRSGNTLTLTATEVDGSTSNESLTISDGTDSENLGGQTLNVAATGIATVDYVPGTNTLTIGAVEVDGSTTNEAWTVDADDSDTELITTQTVKFQGGGITSTDYNPTTNVLLINSIEVDGSTTNEVQTYGHSGTTSYTNTLSLGGGSFTLQAAGIAAISHSAGTVTITATEVDGSISNEGILGVAAGISTTSIITSNTSGATGVTISVAGILTIGETTSTNGGTITLTATEVDGSTSNEIQTYGHSGTTSYTNTLSLGGGSFTLQAASIVSISHSAGTVTISATEVDGSVTNEGILGVGAGIATTSIITSNTSGATGVTISVAGILTIGETTSANGGTITLTATEVDGSVTNELQTFSNSSNATSHTVTLSNSGGSAQFVEGSGITLATTGTGLDGILTITAVDASTTNESLTVSDGTDSENLGGQTLTFAATGIATVDYVPGTNTLTIGAVEVDGSISNEGSLTVAAGTGTTSIINSNTSGSTGVTISVAGILSISESGNVITLTGTEVDGSVTNEIQTISAGDGAGDNKTLDLSLAGGTITLDPAGILTISRTGNTLVLTATEVDGSTTNESLTISDGTDSENLGGQTLTVSSTGIASVDYVPGTNTLTIGAVEVDGSITNEGSLTVAAGTGTTSIINSNTSGSTGVTLTAAGILSISESGNVITLTATEVDGSVTNEALTVSDGTDSEALGGQTLTFAASGIASVDYVPGTNTLTVGAVEVDGSTTNEVQTYGHSGTTSYTNTLSLGGGSFTLQSGGIVSLSHSAGTTTISATEIDGSTTNEIQTISASGAGPTSYNIDLSLSGGSVTLAEGVGVDLTRSGNTITFTFSGDGSNTNEGILGVAAGGSNDALLTSNTSGAVGVTYTGSNGIVVTESTSANGGTITLAMPAGSNTNTMRHNGTAWVASTEIQNNEAEVGIGGAPISGFELYVNGAQRNDGALVSRGTGSNFTANLLAPHLRLWNTTVTTGDTWYLGSEDDGDFSLTSSNLGGIVMQAKATTGQVQISTSLRIGAVTGTPTSIIGRNATGDVGGLTLGPGFSIVSGQLQFSGGGITAANNGLYVSGGTTVRQGTNPLIETTLIDHDGFEYRHSDGKISLTNQATSYTTQGADFGVEGIEALPTLNSTPTKDAIVELRASNAGSAQPNSLAIGAYATDADGIWMQARSHSVPNFEYPLSLQPRGGQMSVGRFGGLDALVTLAATGLTGSTVSGSVLHLEHSEGNGKTAMSMGAGTDILDAEIAWFDATDALRITNRSNTAGTSTVRVAIGGETSDKSMWVASSVAPNVRFGVGQTAPANITSTLHSAGSLATAIVLSSASTLTLDEGMRNVTYTGTANATWTLPTASTCAGREYILFHRGTAGTVTLSASVNKGNGGTFNTLTAGQWAYITSDGSAWSGIKLISL